MPIINTIKLAIERDLAEDRRLALGNLNASQIKALFDLLPDAAWLQIAAHMVRQEPEALGEYLITTHKNYVFQTAVNDIEALFASDLVSQSAITALVD